ncbi:MAG TPA: SDR family oxidoreductase [Gemmatimonadaceae bacterium]|nr:SDR family oxidoreductase [Gemmatimonadaceae bacterium]
MTPLAIITGASEGIGRDLAELYAADGHDVVLVARRAPPLRELAESLERRFGRRAVVVVADLATRDGCDAVIAACAGREHDVVALVNNAGLGAVGWFHELPWEREQAQIDVNVTALAYLTYRILPWLRASGKGHVMQLASVAGFQPGPLMAVYYATKAFVVSFSEALHNECAGTGVTVTAVCPGPTITGFQREAGIRPGGGSGGAPPMASRRVAELAYAAAMRGDRVVFTGLRNRVTAALGRYLPRAWSAAVVRRIQLRRMR